jgi:hypothetical protein
MLFAKSGAMRPNGLEALVEVDRLDTWDTITLDYFKLSLALDRGG